MTTRFESPIWKPFISNEITKVSFVMIIATAQRLRNIWLYPCRFCHCCVVHVACGAKALFRSLYQPKNDDKRMVTESHISAINISSRYNKVRRKKSIKLRLAFQQTTTPTSSTQSVISKLQLHEFLVHIKK